MNSNTNHTMGFPDMHSLAVATVGTKGQIVIPQEVREKLHLEAGDKVVILMREQHVAVMLPMAGMGQWLDKMTADFDEIKSIVSRETDKNTKGND
jgi:AbrB family looped-hinge helix DNA binding protein